MVKIHPRLHLLSKLFGRFFNILNTRNKQLVSTQTGEHLPISFCVHGENSNQKKTGTLQETFEAVPV
jgi:hypothetical protein